MAFRRQTVISGGISKPPKNNARLSSSIQTKTRVTHVSSEGSAGTDHILPRSVVRNHSTLLNGPHAHEHSRGLLTTSADTSVSSSSGTGGVAERLLMYSQKFMGSLAYVHSTISSRDRRTRANQSLKLWKLFEFG